MTSFCRKRTEVTFDKSLRTQNTIIQNTRNQRKLIYFYLNQNKKQHVLLARLNKNSDPN